MKPPGSKETAWPDVIGQRGIRGAKHTEPVNLSRPTSRPSDLAASARPPMFMPMIRLSGLRPRWLALTFLPLLCVPLPATADLAGIWDVTEFDPFIPDNDFWGQFKYRLEIVRSPEGYRLTVPRTGARLQAPEIDGDRLTATGSEPGRGELRLEITFADNSFEGTLHTEQNRRRVTGRLDPSAQLDRIEGSVRAAEARADSAFAEAAAVRAQRDALERQVAVLSRQIGTLRESQRATARELQIAREQLESPSKPTPEIGRAHV